MAQTVSDGPAHPGSRAERAPVSTCKPFSCARCSNAFCLLHVIPQTLRPPAWLQGKATELLYWEPVNLICGWNPPNPFWLLSLSEIWRTENWWCVKTFKLLGREFSQGFFTLWVLQAFVNILMGTGVTLMWVQCISLYLGDLLNCLFLDSPKVPPQAL